MPAAGSNVAHVVSSKQPQYIPYQCVTGSDTLMNLALDKAPRDVQFHIQFSS